MKNLKKLISIIFIIIMASCANTKEIQKVYIKDVDTVYITKMNTDSIFIKDSIFVERKNDTVYVDKLRIKENTKIKVDTVYKYVLKETAQIDKKEKSDNKLKIISIIILMGICVILSLIVIKISIKK